MVEDVVGGAIEVLASGLTPDDAPKRYRKGCWWLTWIVLALAAVTIAVIMLRA